MASSSQAVATCLLLAALACAYTCSMVSLYWHQALFVCSSRVGIASKIRVAKRQGPHRWSGVIAFEAMVTVHPRSISGRVSGVHCPWMVPGEQLRAYPGAYQMQGLCYAAAAVAPPRGLASLKKWGLPSSCGGVVTPSRIGIQTHRRAGRQARNSTGVSRTLLLLATLR